MFRLTDVIRSHNDMLRAGLQQSSLEQRRDILVAVLGLFLTLPSARRCLRHHLRVRASNTALLEDVCSGNTGVYRKKVQRYNAQLNPYAHDFDELGAAEVYFLEVFTAAVWGTDDEDDAFRVLSKVTDLLFHYEEFSRQPRTWNTLLKQEVAFQEDLISCVVRGDRIQHDVYVERYDNTSFPTV